MNNYDFVVKHGINVGNNARVLGNTLNINNLVSMSSLSNLPIGETETVIDTIDTQITRSVKYQILTISGIDCQNSELLLLQNGSQSRFNEYGILTTTGEPLVVFNTSVVSNQVQLKARMISGSGNVWINKTSINTVQAETPQL